MSPTAHLTFPLGCLTGTIYLTCPKQNPFILSSRTTTFPISGNGTSFLPVGSAPNLGIIPVSLFFPFISYIKSTENSVSSTIKIHPKSNHFSPPLLLSSQIQDTVTSHRYYCNNLLIVLHTAILVPLQLIVHIAARTVLLKHESYYINSLLKFLQWFPVSLR